MHHSLRSVYWPGSFRFKHKKQIENEYKDSRIRTVKHKRKGMFVCDASCVVSQPQLWGECLKNRGMHMVGNLTLVMSSCKLSFFRFLLSLET
ncbi:hypothetical protein VNO78_08195 [Psophocarpus tetragonolobus]|uniref:Uncharacterized protein n=1 Tax=Psophocarpus tetragonolobus TaxID=3891 RepID=A0AAN9XSR5_PSOTE